MANLSLIRARIFALVLIAVCSFLIRSCSTQTQKTCFSPDQYSGRCVKLEMCEALSAMRYSERQTHLIRLYVTLSHCGTENNQPFVCCTSSPYPKKSLESSVEFKTTLTSFATKSTQKQQKSFECARILDNHIFGGRETKINEMPFTTLLVYSSIGGTFNQRPKVGFFCGGSLISESHVVTAAHCTHEETLATNKWILKGVRLGEWDLAQNPDCDKSVCAPPVLDQTILRNIVHEGYVPFDSNLKHDIALLQLRNSVEFNDFVRPICLPTTANEDFKDAEFTIAGFGKTELLDNSRTKLKTDVRSISNAECQKLNTNQLDINSNQMCALGEDGKDLCHGDSGQPLTYSNMKTKRLELVGIVSSSPNPCGQFNKPGIYTRVSSYIDWIKKNMK